MNESYTPSETHGSQAAHETSTTDLGSKFANSETQTRRSTKDPKTAASSTVEEFRDKAQQTWEDTQERARSFRKEGEQYVRANPTRAVFSALGIGFLLGLIFKR